MMMLREAAREMSVEEVGSRSKARRKCAIETKRVDLTQHSKPHNAGKLGVDTPERSITASMLLLLLLLMPEHRTTISLQELLG